MHQYQARVDEVVEHRVLVGRALEVKEDKVEGEVVEEVELGEVEEILREVVQPVVLAELVVAKEDWTGFSRLVVERKEDRGFAGMVEGEEAAVDPRKSLDLGAWLVVKVLP